MLQPVSRFADLEFLGHYTDHLVFLLWSQEHGTQQTARELPSAPASRDLQRSAIGVRVEAIPDLLLDDEPGVSELPLLGTSAIRCPPP